MEERIKKTKAEVQAEADTAVAALRRELTEATDERDVAVAEVAVCRKAAETAVDTLKKRHQQELDDAVRGCETTAWERQVGPIYFYIFLLARVDVQFATGDLCCRLTPLPPALYSRWCRMSSTSSRSRDFVLRLSTVSASLHGTIVHSTAIWHGFTSFIKTSLKRRFVIVPQFLNNRVCTTCIHGRVG